MNQARLGGNGLAGGGLGPSHRHRSLRLAIAPSNPALPGARRRILAIAASTSSSSDGTDQSSTNITAPSKLATITSRMLFLAPIAALASLGLLPRPANAAWGGGATTQPAPPVNVIDPHSGRPSRWIQKRGDYTDEEYEAIFKHYAEQSQPASTIAFPPARKAAKAATAAAAAAQRDTVKTVSTTTVTASTTVQPNKQQKAAAATTPAKGKAAAATTSAAAAAGVASSQPNIIESAASFSKAAVDTISKPLHAAADSLSGIKATATSTVAAQMQSIKDGAQGIKVRLHDTFSSKESSTGTTASGRSASSKAITNKGKAAPAPASAPQKQQSKGRAATKHQVNAPAASQKLDGVDFGKQAEALRNRFTSTVTTQTANLKQRIQGISLPSFAAPAAAEAAANAKGKKSNDNNHHRKKKQAATVVSKAQNKSTTSTSSNKDKDEAVVAPFVALQQRVSTAVAEVPHAEVIAGGIVLAAVLLGLLRWQRHSNNVDQGSDNNTNNNGITSINYGSNGSGGGGSAGGSAAAQPEAGAAAVGAAALGASSLRSWEPAPIPAVRSKEEIMAEASRRIDAAKQAMAKASETQQGNGLGVDVAEAVGAAATPTATTGSIGGGSSSTAVIDRPSSTAVTGNGSSSSNTWDDESVQSFFSASPSSSSSTDNGEISSQSNTSPTTSNGAFNARYSPRPASSTTSAGSSSAPSKTWGAFVNALDADSPATPLVAVLGLAAAAFDGLTPMFQRTVRVKSAAKGPGASLACSRVPGNGNSLQVATSRAPTPPPAAATSTTSSSSVSSSMSPFDVLLAPAAPLAAFFAPSDPNAPKINMNKYDVVLDVLQSALHAPETASNTKFDPLRSLLASAPPKPGRERWDFTREIVRSIAMGQNDVTAGKYDMIHDLLQAIAVPNGPISAERFDPVKDLLHTAMLVEDWGPPRPSPYDPLEDVASAIADRSWALSDWAGASRYCPVSALLEINAPARTKTLFDPASALLKGDWEWKAPTSKSKYDMMSAALGALGNVQAPRKSTDPRYDAWDPVSAALDAAAGWTPPAAGDARSRYDMTSDVLAGVGALVSAPGRGLHRNSSSLWDPLRWALNGWGGDWEAPKGSSKFDMLPAVFAGAETAAVQVDGALEAAKQQTEKLSNKFSGYGW